MDPEPCDLRGLEPQLAKDLLGVLAEDRWRATHSGRGVCHFEGHIGPSIASQLEAIRVYVVFDLLRATTDELHVAVKDVASAAQVRAWRQAATLLQAAEVTPQWADALIKNGIFTIADLGRARLDELEAIFLKAKQDGVIPDAPSLPQIGAMLKDAVVLDRSGAITGTVRDQAGQPVADATALAGAIRQTTDARGRFRLLRIPLASSVTLRIEHQDFKPFERVMERVPGVSRVHVEVIQLVARPIGASPAPARTLAEVAGDVLPLMTGQPLVCPLPAASGLLTADAPGTERIANINAIPGRGPCGGDAGTPAWEPREGSY